MIIDVAHGSLQYVVKMELSVKEDVLYVSRDGTFYPFYLCFLVYRIGSISEEWSEI